MRTKIVAGGLIALSALAWGTVSAQRTQPLPGPGSGIVTVEGRVDIGNIPTVSALQEGAWKVTLTSGADVTIANTPSVTLAPAEFLKADAQYAVVWPTGERETVRIAEIGSSGWVRIEGKDQRRWLNIAVARSVDEVP